MFKTLIVEDNVTFRQMLGDLLRVNYPSMLIAHAESITEAWKKFFEIRPGLVFVDIRLHEENGLDLTRDIRKSHPDVIVAVVTGHNFPEYREVAYRYGAHYFIPKSTANASDFLRLIDSIQTGQPPQWSLGSEFINPSPPVRPKK